MIISAKLICLVIAVILFFLAIGLRWARPAENRFDLIAAGLFFFALRELFP